MMMCETTRSRNRQQKLSPASSGEEGPVVGGDVGTFLGGSGGGAVDIMSETMYSHIESTLLKLLKATADKNTQTLDNMTGLPSPAKHIQCKIKDKSSLKPLTRHRSTYSHHHAMQHNSITTMPIAQGGATRKEGSETLPYSWL